MAETVAVGSGAHATIRKPVAVVLLTLITLGIYAVVWHYKVNKEMAALGKARGTSDLGENPVNSVLAVTLGALVIVPAVISVVNTFRRVQATQRLAGVEPINGWIGLLLGLLLGPVLNAYEQSGLNAAFGELAVGAPASSAARPAPVAV